ncbi:MAG TPA: hypothetical protein PKA76_00005, partial [Pirellulaceae bacterium]|nr:hypothetical protein [Pirellulaceae bacterium]
MTHRHHIKFAIRIGILAFVALYFAPFCFAQRLFPQRPAGRTADVINAVAYAGEPFGLGRIVFRVGNDPLVLQTGAVRIFERGTRVHYPAFSE